MVVTEDRIQAYLRELQALLPEGAAWARDKGANLTKLLTAFGAEFAQVSSRGDDLLREADPRTTVELLEDWERVFGLPGVCTGNLTNTEARRAAILAKMARPRSESIAYYLALALKLGYAVTIVEHRPFIVGHSQTGDAMDNDPVPFRVGVNKTGDAFTTGPAWIFTWDVHAPLNTIRPFMIGRSTIGEPLASWQNVLLECSLQGEKPAHTLLRFVYAP